MHIFILFGKIYLQQQRTTNKTKNIIKILVIFHQTELKRENKK